MLEFTDLPYQFFPPRPKAAVIRLAHWFNHSVVLPGPNHRISDLRLEGADPIKNLIASGAKILLLPNHSTHSDPQIMSELHRRLGVESSFMAAYDVFLRSKFNTWVMQSTGSFSVDREGSDRKAMATAIDVLKQRGSLTIFPEGNVYFTNDRPTPFLEGAAFIGLKAQKDLGTETPVYAVPVAIKATHLIDQRAAILDRLAFSAQLAGCDALDRKNDPLEELRRIGLLVLEKYLGEHDIEIPKGKKDIHASLEASAEKMIGQLEPEIGLSPKTGADLTERVRKIRSKIHQLRIDSNSELDPEITAGWADRAILVLRMLGYTDTYVAEHPSVDRFAETVEKLAEDIQSIAQKPYGKRRAIVRLCDPIDLRSTSGRSAVGLVTDQVEQAVQTALDQINSENHTPGSQLFTQSQTV